MNNDEAILFLDASCRVDFSVFAQKAFEVVEPGVKLEWNWHLDCLCDHMQALYEDKLPEGKTRLCINVPPRSLKSFLTSIAFPAWVIGRDASKKFICTSFGFSLAKEMSQKSRIIFESDWYKRVFPNVIIDNTQNEKHNFWTSQRGMYYSSAILSITGRGADYVILDDPINPKEAFSDTIRNDTNATIRSTIPTRFNDLRAGKWLLIMQRLHEDDPTGNLTNDGRWFKLILPGENLTDKVIRYELNGRSWEMKPGDLLFPQRLPKNILNDLRDDLGDYNYAGQILQVPVPIGGGEFKHEWVGRYSNGSLRPKDMNVYILVDAAAGEESNKRKRKLSDFTAMMVIGLGTDNNFYLLDAIRDKMNPTERIGALFLLHRKWNELCGKPPKVGYEKYGMMTDTHYIRERMKQESYNFMLEELGGNVSKEQRIRRLIPDMQSGRWYFPDSLLYIDSENRQFDLVKEIFDSEMATFPRARHDDMIDAMSRIYDMDMLFPRQKLGMVANARETAYYEQEQQSWEDF